MFEHHKDPIAQKHKFVWRMFRHICLGILIIAISLYIGMLGYHHFEKMNWVDAYVNAAMILSGMGPVGQLNTTGGKIFAGSYAIYSGLLLITVIAFMALPVIHRFFHNFHMDPPKDPK